MVSDVFPGARQSASAAVVRIDPLLQLRRAAAASSVAKQGEQVVMHPWLRQRYHASAAEGPRLQVRPRQLGLGLGFGLGFGIRLGLRLGPVAGALCPTAAPSKMVAGAGTGEAIPTHGATLVASPKPGDDAGGVKHMAAR